MPVVSHMKPTATRVPRADVLRRFARGGTNFATVYRPLADAWAVYDNSGDTPRLLETGP
jgi:predicted ABC-type ATPase